MDDDTGWKMQTSPLALMDPAVRVVIMRIQSVTNEQQSPLIQGTAVHMKESSS